VKESTNVKTAGGWGKFQFVPPKNWNPSNPAKGPQNGFLDKFGNEWVRGPSRTRGQAFEWDVQIQSIGAIFLMTGSTLIYRLMGMPHTSRNQFDFYEVVEILEPEIMPRRLWHTHGVVQGMSQSESGIWEYAILVYEDNKEVWQLEQRFLKPTGKQMTRDDFYDGTSVKVVVDLESGEGKQKEDD
jgi:hypothetical protein